MYTQVRQCVFSGDFMKKMILLLLFYGLSLYSNPYKNRLYTCVPIVKSEVIKKFTETLGDGVLLSIHHYGISAIEALRLISDKHLEEIVRFIYSEDANNRFLSSLERIHKYQAKYTFFEDDGKKTFELESKNSTHYAINGIQHSKIDGYKYNEDYHHREILAFIKENFAVVTLFNSNAMSVVNYEYVRIREPKDYKLNLCVHRDEDQENGGKIVKEIIEWLEEKNAHFKPDGENRNEWNPIDTQEELDYLLGKTINTANRIKAEKLSFSTLVNISKLFFEFLSQEEQDLVLNSIATKIPVTTPIIPSFKIKPHFLLKISPFGVLSSILLFSGPAVSDINNPFEEYKKIDLRELLKIIMIQALSIDRIMKIDGNYEKTVDFMKKIKEANLIVYFLHMMNEILKLKI